MHVHEKEAQLVALHDQVGHACVFLYIIKRHFPPITASWVLDPQFDPTLTLVLGVWGDLIYFKHKSMWICFVYWNFTCFCLLFVKITCFCLFICENHMLLLIICENHMLLLTICENHMLLVILYLNCMCFSPISPAFHMKLSSNSNFTCFSPISPAFHQFHLLFTWN